MDSPEARPACQHKLEDGVLSGLGPCPDTAVRPDALQADLVDFIQRLLVDKPDPDAVAEAGKEPGRVTRCEGST